MIPVGWGGPVSRVGCGCVCGAVSSQCSGWYGPGHLTESVGPSIPGGITISDGEVDLGPQCYATAPAEPETPRRHGWRTSSAGMSWSSASSSDGRSGFGGDATEERGTATLLRLETVQMETQRCRSGSRAMSPGTGIIPLQHCRPLSLLTAGELSIFLGSGQKGTTTVSVGCWGPPRTVIETMKAPNPPGSSKISERGAHPRRPLV
jgi:hypothetical protein